ncbi:hypothetical protein TNCV_1351991 [Trichonephila clavipes]|nr:hypothetical protein TNCV_1351991 [Trichonephila clavipes]
MAQHRPRKSAPTEYATDEEDMITYDVEEEELEPDPTDKFTIKENPLNFPKGYLRATATAGSDVVQSGRHIFDDFFQYSLPYIGNNTANVVFQMVKRLWLIRIDQ